MSQHKHKPVRKGAGTKNPGQFNGSEKHADWFARQAGAVRAAARRRRAVKAVKEHAPVVATIAAIAGGVFSSTIRTIEIAAAAMLIIGLIAVAVIRHGGEDKTKQPAKGAADPVMRPVETTDAGPGDRLLGAENGAVARFGWGHRELRVLRRLGPDNELATLTALAPYRDVEVFTTDKATDACVAETDDSTVACLRVPSAAELKASGGPGSVNITTEDDPTDTN